MIQISYGNNRVAIYKRGKCVWLKVCRNPKQTAQVYHQVMTLLLEKHNEV